MVKIYVMLILSGAKSLDDVPEKWRDEVTKALEGKNEDR